MLDIGKDMIAKRHSKTGAERGEAYANLSMCFLRALFNFAIAQYEDGSGHAILRENPVMRLTQTRAWYRVDRRQTVIKPHQLAPWYQATLSLKQDQLSKQSALVADYLLFLLFTGLRRQEAATLKWSDQRVVVSNIKIYDGDAGYQHPTDLMGRNHHADR